MAAGLAASLRGEGTAGHEVGAVVGAPAAAQGSRERDQRMHPGVPSARSLDAHVVLRVVAEGKHPAAHRAAVRTARCLSLPEMVVQNAAGVAWLMGRSNGERFDFGFGRRGHANGMLAVLSLTGWPVPKREEMPNLLATCLCSMLGVIPVVGRPPPARPAGRLRRLARPRAAAEPQRRADTRPMARPPHGSMNASPPVLVSVAPSSCSFRP